MIIRENGNDMNNIVVNGKIRGRTKEEYEQATHFIYEDKIDD